MPELPEVETTRRGIEPHVTGATIVEVNIRQPSLRWPIPDEIGALANKTISHVARRGKYLLLACYHGKDKAQADTLAGTVIMHLGMSGSLRICAADAELRKHDHLQFILDNGYALRLHDPRRFGCALWCAGDPMQHPLLEKLGPEPLSNAFNAESLFKASRKRKVAVKNFIMSSQTVVGVGNIYASESLFMSGIRPGRAAMRVTRAEYVTLTDNIKQVLSHAIKMGGTTLRDFVNSDGNPGYFAQQLLVYGREDEPCHTCKALIKNRVIGQRSSFYCPQCQH